MELFNLKTDTVLSVKDVRELGSSDSYVNVEIEMEASDGSFYTIKLNGKKDKNKEYVLLKKCEKIITEKELMEDKDILSLFENPAISKPTKFKKFFGKNKMLCPFKTKFFFDTEVNYSLKKEVEMEKRYKVIYKEIESNQKNHAESMKYAYDEVKVVERTEKESGVTLKQARSNNTNFEEYISRFAWHMLYYHNRTIKDSTPKQITDYIDEIKKKQSKTYQTFTKVFLKLYENNKEKYNKISTVLKDVGTRKDFEPEYLDEEIVEKYEKEYLLNKVNNLANDLAKKMTPQRLQGKRNKYVQALRDYAIFLLIKHHALTNKGVREAHLVEYGKMDEIKFRIDGENKVIPCVSLEKGLLYTSDTEKPEKLHAEVLKAIINYRNESGTDSDMLFTNRIIKTDGYEFQPIAESIVLRACSNEHPEKEKRITADKLRTYSLGLKLENEQIRSVKDLKEKAKELKTSRYTVEHIKEEQQTKKIKAEMTPKYNKVFSEKKISMKLFMKKSRFSVKVEDIHLKSDGFDGFVASDDVCEDMNIYEPFLHNQEKTIKYIRKFAKLGDVTEHLDGTPVLQIPFYLDQSSDLLIPEFIQLFKGISLKEKESNTRQYIKTNKKSMFLIYTHQEETDQQWQIAVG